MTTGQGMPRESGEKHALDSPVAIPGGTIYSHNMDDSKTPGGIKVRWKVRVVTGPEAARYDARQAEAIREILQWLHRSKRQART